MTEIKQKVMLITGTRKGLGRALAEHFIEQGLQVIGCSRGESDLEANNYTHFCLDVQDEKAALQMFFKIRKKFSRLDIVINNAGIASMNHALLTPMSTVRSIFETNVFGTFLFCREAAKLMSLNKNGRIINFTTVATPLRLTGEVPYAASKAAVISITEILALELGPLGITVNAIGPNPIKTDLTKGVPVDKMDALLARQAIPRFGENRDVINVVEFFIDDRSDFITGQKIFLGGV